MFFLHLIIFELDNSTYFFYFSSHRAHIVSESLDFKVLDCGGATRERVDIKYTVNFQLRF